MPAPLADLLHAEAGSGALEVVCEGATRGMLAARRP